MGPVDKNIAEYIIAKNHIPNLIWVAFYSQILLYKFIIQILPNNYHRRLHSAYEYLILKCVIWL